MSKAVDNLFEWSETRIIWQQSILLTFLNANDWISQHPANNILQNTGKGYFKKFHF